MKNTFLLLLVTILSITTLEAQSGKGDFTIAPQIGINLATFAPSDTDFSYEARTSFAGGAITEFYFSDRWSLRSGLLFDPMGAEDGGGNIDKLNYLTLPINANWHFGRNRNWYLNFGPAISFLLNAETELREGSTIDISEVVPGTDFGLAFGIGYKFDINEKLQLFIDYQGFGGFSNIDDTDVLPFEIRNSRSAFNLGVVITP
jgi:hypothetical protein